MRRDYSPISTVAILMATKDGGRFLRDQLESLAAQTHRNWSLYVSDDGSSDDTIKILQEFKLRTSRLVDIRLGPKEGPAENFMSLSRDPRISADLFAFSDQDDVWLEDKLERAIARLGAVSNDLPALYCSRTLLVDEGNERALGKSPLFRRTPGFGNALVQSLAGGNTMVFNRAAKRLLEQASAKAVFHDWRTYQLVTGAGGVVIYDEAPSVRYRQHAANVIGSNQGWAARLNRMTMLIRGRFGDWNDVNISALRTVRELLTPASAEQLAQFERARHGSLAGRIACLRRSGVYRQTWGGSFALYIAALLSKL